MPVALHTLWDVARAWLGDHVFRRLLRNASWLAAGNMLSSVIGLVTMAVTARVLDPSGFGLFALMTTYVALVDRLLNFQTSQALIKFGAEAIEAGDNAKMKSLIKFCTCLDASSACIATLIAVTCIPLVNRFLGLDGTQMHWLAWFCAVILFNLSGAPTGILRLYNRFHILSYIKVGVAVIGCIGACLIWFYGLGLREFLAVQALSQIVGNIVLFAFSWRLLGHNGLTGIFSVPLRNASRAAEGLWNFVFFTNIEGSIKIIRDLDIFVIKYCLSNEAVGLYRVARKLAEALNMVIDPFFYAVYPEFSKYAARNDAVTFKRLVLQSGLMVGVPTFVAWLGFLAVGDMFIRIVFSNAYAGSFNVTAICMAGGVLWGFFQPLSPALYSLGAYRAVFAIHLATALSYIALVALLTPIWGELGAAAAHVVLFVIWGSLSMRTLVVQYQKKWNENGV